jgi:hypothetical protein
MFQPLHAAGLAHREYRIRHSSVQKPNPVAAGSCFLRLPADAGLALDGTDVLATLQRHCAREL